MTTRLTSWVYRDGRRREPGAALVAELAASLSLVRGLRAETRRRAAVETIVAAGTLEAALADVEHPSAAIVARVTDHLADLALEQDDAAEPPAIAGLDVPGELWTSPPEGCAYYALHPEAYARATAAVTAERVLVVGVRSIGTTLSAMARAALAVRGIVASRLTVRPHGPPHDRRLVPSGAEAAAFARAAEDGSTVLVVDEGPGLSGSTFLAVAEALVRAGVPRERVILVCSHEPDVEALGAEGAPERFRAFRRIVAPSDVRTPRGHEISAGSWRTLVWDDADAWPASWTTTERRKWRDGGRLVKFEGIGRAGAEVRARLEALADARWTPGARPEGDGFVSSPWLGGRPLSAGDRDRLARVARYCADRPSLCPARHELTDLVPMVQKNLAELFGRTARGLALRVERPCVCDGRMMPHEWRLADDGALYKHDAASHGDDHFFPGPTDIAWDLAGVLVEWNASRGERDAFLDAYERASGDDVRPRLGPWIVAYVAFRGAWLASACAALRWTPESTRLERALARHREAGSGWLAGAGLSLC